MLHITNTYSTKNYKKKKTPKPYLSTFHKDLIAPLLIEVRPVTFKNRSCHYPFCLPCSRVDISTIIYCFYKIKSSHKNPTLSRALTVKHFILNPFLKEGV